MIYPQVFCLLAIFTLPLTIVYADSRLSRRSDMLLVLLQLQYISPNWFCRRNVETAVDSYQHRSKFKLHKDWNCPTKGACRHRKVPIDREYFQCLQPPLDVREIVTLLVTVGTQSKGTLFVVVNNLIKDSILVCTYTDSNFDAILIKRRQVRLYNGELNLKSDGARHFYHPMSYQSPIQSEAGL